MLVISKHISNLLFYHECVVLPNFGGFVCNYKPAYIQAIQHKFYPPSKQITFNKNLTSNDGLLAHHISKNEKCSYDEALKMIEDFVLSIKNTLKDKKELLLEDIGTFVVDNENRLHFEPSLNKNYLLNSYGLSVFQVNPIKKETLEQQISEQLKTIPKNKTNHKKWVAAAAVFVPLFILTIWIPSNYDLSTTINYAKLNPFENSTNKVAYHQRKNSTVYVEDDLLLLKNELEINPNKPGYLSFTWIKNEKPIAIELNKVEAAKIDTTSVALKRNFRYHIIAGCFSEKRNARKMVSQLKNKGFDAWIIGKRNDLWTVSYNSFTSKNEAISALATAKSDNRKAWILEYL